MTIIICPNKLREVHASKELNGAKLLAIAGIISENFARIALSDMLKRCKRQPTHYKDTNNT